jgi:hypothetical protein
MNMANAQTCEVVVIFNVASRNAVWLQIFEKYTVSITTVFLQCKTSLLHKTVKNLN